MKTYKAIMHFNKTGSKKGLPWTIHSHGVCYLVKEIRWATLMISEWKPKKKSNPRAFFTAKASTLSITKNKVAILK